MRDRDPNPSGHSPRPRAVLVLGLLAAIEAVAIVFLVMARASEGERAPTLRAPTEQAAPVVPAFSPPMVDHGREAARSTELGAQANAEPQPLAAPRTDTGDVGLVLCGTVTVDDGRPLGECTVEVDEGPIEAHVPVHQGTYSVAGLEPGVCTVSCSADGCLSRPVQVALDASRPIERLDLRLERLPVIPVRIRTPEGRSLLELFDEAKLPGRLRPSVTLQAPSPQAPLGEEVSANWTDFVNGLADSPGEAELKAAGWDGVLRVRVPLPVYVNLIWEQRVLATEAVTAPSAGVTFTVDFEALMRELSTVRARVVDFDSGQPVEGALAQLDRDYLQGDDTGVFQFEKVTPGPHTLHIIPPGAWFGISDSLAIVGANDATHAEANVSLETKAGQQLDLGDLRLQRTVLVRGRVTDAGGRPLEVNVIATRADADADSQARSSRLVVSPNANDGSFSVRVVPGRWSFSTSNDSQAPGAKVLDIRGDIDGVNLIGVSQLTK